MNSKNIFLIFLLLLQTVKVRAQPVEKPPRWKELTSVELEILKQDQFIFKMEQ